MRFEAGKPLAPLLFRGVPSSWLLGSERKVQPWTEPRAPRSLFRLNFVMSGNELAVGGEAAGGGRLVLWLERRMRTPES